MVPGAVCRRKCAAESSVPRRIAVGRVLSGEMPGGRLPMEYPAAHCGGYLKRGRAVRCRDGCLPAEMRDELFGGEVSGGGVGRRVPADWAAGSPVPAAYCRGACVEWGDAGRPFADGNARSGTEWSWERAVSGKGSGGGCLPTGMRGGLFCPAAYCRGACVEWRDAGRLFADGVPGGALRRVSKEGLCGAVSGRLFACGLGGGQSCSAAYCRGAVCRVTVCHLPAGMRGRGALSGGLSRGALQENRGSGGESDEGLGRDAGGRRAWLGMGRCGPLDGC